MFERCLYFNTNALARRVNREWEAAYGAFDLSPAHAYLLRLILAQPGLSQKQIGEELGLEKSTVTRFVDSLEARGYLQRRQAGDDDARRLRIFPTAKSKRLQDKLEATGEQLYQRMQTLLHKDTMTRLITEMRKARLALEND